MAEYFYRFSSSEEWHDKDVKRGYSFHSYAFQGSPEELLEQFGYEYENNEELEMLIENQNIRQNSDGRYGFALDGLCGYGPFDSAEDAEEDAQNGCYGMYTVCGIYEGIDAGLDPDLSQLFRPIRLIKVFDTQER